VINKPEWLNASNVTDIYSVASCCSEDFTDYINYWRHNEYSFFDSPRNHRSTNGPKLLSRYDVLFAPARGVLTTEESV
jgi:hypothetical protein